jgi:hypothetical protein
MMPNPKSHHDDYLSLGASYGHPGEKKYMPLIGYTIQAEDGLGFYRLADTSIQKWNDTLLPKEDGLDVKVYVNDTFVGSGQSVLTNGQLSGFDMTLGTLNVGDTVWLAIDPLKYQTDDAFINFDFTLQKLVYSASQNFAFNAQSIELSQIANVPEPSTAVFLLTALAIFRPRRRT